MWRATGGALGGDRRAIIRPGSDFLAVRPSWQRRTGAQRLRRDEVRPITGIAFATVASLVLWAVLLQMLVWALTKLF